jgi:hypothetical protein
VGNLLEKLVASQIRPLRRKNIIHVREDKILEEQSCYIKLNSSFPRKQ